MNKIKEKNPLYINLTNPQYIEIDGMFFSSLLIINYNRIFQELIFKNILEINENILISIYIEKNNQYKIIKEIAKNIGNTTVDLEKINNSRIDIDIAKSSLEDAKYIRKEMQLNNQQLLYFYTYITTYSKNKEELKNQINKIEEILQNSGLKSKKSYFRQEQTILANLPLNKNNSDIKRAVKRNILTDGIKGTYPFITSTIYDEEGILYGTDINNNSLIIIDKFDREKYKNSNTCIFGSSGSGKSYFTKIQVLRNYILNINQYIIDPEREYEKISKSLDGSLIKIGPASKTYINIFDIREDSLEENEEGYLATKLNKLIGFFKLIFQDITEEERTELENKIIKIYKNKNIDFNDKSLFKNNKFKTSTDMPILEDLYKELNKRMQKKIEPFITGSLKCFNNYTNIELNNKLIIGDIYELGEENIQFGMYIFIELFWDKIKKDRNSRKIIYLDEIWRLIGITSNKETASFIYKIFKTIRKYGGGATAITQDVSDLFSLEEGAYGKSILNNSELKLFFSLEEENIKTLEKYIDINEKEKIEIKSLRKGESLFFVGQDHILTKINSDKFEKELIE
ncbi:MAG: ATP-binding protein [Clostridiales bacterium]|nr:ATP-binding protein [Clostridiales bacterium]MBF0986382.1 ATP-binding protein [Clostridiales bacterium]